MNSSGIIASCTIRSDAEALTLVLSGGWTIAASVPRFEDLKSSLGAGVASSLEFDCAALERWDSILVVWVLHCREFCKANALRFGDAGLPEGVRRLMALALAVPAEQRLVPQSNPLWRRFLSGEWLVPTLQRCAASLAFIGEVVIALGRLLRGRASTRLVVSKTLPCGLSRPQGRGTNSCSLTVLPSPSTLICSRAQKICWCVGPPRPSPIMPPH